jgi:hypothetical protein
MIITAMCALNGLSTSSCLSDTPTRRAKVIASGRRLSRAAVIGSDEVPNSTTPPSGQSGRNPAPPGVMPRNSLIPLVIERPRSPCSRCL